MAIYDLKDHDLLSDDFGQKYILKVKDLAEADKPREKLTKYGPENLSAAELLAIILGVGTKKEEVLVMANRVLKEYGEKSITNQKNPKILEKDLQIPANKACQIIACFELGRRFFKKTNGGPVEIRTARQAFEYLKDMRELPKENLRGLYLNSHYRLIHDEVISVGSLTANIIHPREVFKPALEYSAAAVIIAHNHPSGDCTPTSADIETTKQLMEAAKILGIDLLDHLIITKNKFVRIKINLKIRNKLQETKKSQ
jgi:DNA repair protein RadC